MIILNLCGIPGSGKSFFAQKLQKLGDFRWEVISFDDIGNRYEWDHESFQRIRAAGLEQLEDILKQQHSNVNFDKHALLPSLNQGVLLDDIMYLKSMRREVFTIAQRYNVPVLTVWVKTDSSLSLERLKCRTTGEQVSPAVFDKINNHFEAPSTKYIFDRHHCVVCGETLESLTAGISEVEQRIGSLWSLHLAAVLNSVVVRPVHSSNDTRHSDGETSALLLLDSTLRKVIAGVMKWWVATPIGGGRGSGLGAVLAEGKAAAMRSARAHKWGESSMSAQPTHLTMWLGVFERLVLEAAAAQIADDCEARLDGLRHHLQVALASATKQ